jgi:hypothetical protein
MIFGPVQALTSAMSLFEGCYCLHNKLIHVAFRKLSSVRFIPQVSLPYLLYVSLKLMSELSFIGFHLSSCNIHTLDIESFK